MAPPKPHVFVVPLPVQSHIAPMMHFAKLLASHGIQVSFLLAQSSYSRLVHAQTTQAAPIHGFELVCLADGLPPPPAPHPGLKELISSVNSMITGARELVEEHVKQGTPVTAIIADIFVAWAAGFAQECSLSYFSYSVITATGFAAHVYMPPEQLLAKVKNELPDDAAPITLLPGMTPLYPDEYPLPPGLTSIQEIHLLIGLFKRASKADAVLVHTIYDIEPATIDALRKDGVSILPVGPCIPYSFLGVKDTTDSSDVPNFWKAEENCLEWLDSRAAKSVIYISFGSVASLSFHQIRQLAMGVEESGHDFLWVARFDASMVGEASFEDALPEGFLARTKARGLIVSWAPQLRVLSHASVGAFFFQFGWSSSIESICMGVPMMGWPHFADNPVNSKLLAKECEVAAQCKKGKDGVVRKSEVVRVIREVMGGGEGGARMRRKVKELKGAARRAMREGGSTYESIQKLVDDLKKKNS